MLWFIAPYKGNTLVVFLFMPFVAMQGGGVVFGFRTKLGGGKKKRRAALH